MDQMQLPGPAEQYGAGTDGPGDAEMGVAGPQAGAMGGQFAGGGAMAGMPGMPGHPMTTQPLGAMGQQGQQPMMNMAPYAPQAAGQNAFIYQQQVPQQQPQPAAPPADGSMKMMSREERFEAAFACREEGKGVKPRQGCASVQLNRECKEGTRTPEFAKFLEVVRNTADNEVLQQFGTNSSAFDRADYLQVDRPLTFAAEVTEKYFDTAPWQKAMPRNSGKGEFETRWLCRHVIAQQATAAKRQMRCNQIPRKMLQKLQEDHHRRRLEAERSGPIQGGVTGGTNPPDPAQPNAAAQAPQSAAAAGGGYSPATNAGRNPAEGLAPQRGGAGRAQVPPWASDLRVIKADTARNRIESALSSIQAQLRTGCVEGETVHNTVQLTYALVFGTLGPMLQAVFNLTVLYQRDFQLCQQVLCTIAGAITRLFGSNWDMSLESILAPGMREFALRTGGESLQRFARLEQAVCFVWSCLLNSAERNYVSYAMIDSWASIPAGLWGENRTTTVPGMQRADADAAVLSASGGTRAPSAPAPGPASASAAGCAAASSTSGSTTGDDGNVSEDSVDSQAVSSVAGPEASASSGGEEEKRRQEEEQRGGGSAAAAEAGWSAYNMQLGMDDTGAQPPQPAGQPEGGQPAGQPRPQRSVETVPLSSMVARNGSQSAAAPSNDGGGAVGQAAPIPTETPTMSFDWAAPPQQPEQQQAYGASAPAAIAQPVREADADAQGDSQPKKRRIDAPAQAAQETTAAGDQA